MILQSFRECHLEERPLLHALADGVHAVSPLLLQPDSALPLRLLLTILPCRRSEVISLPVPISSAATCPFMEGKFSDIETSTQFKHIVFCSRRELVSRGSLKLAKALKTQFGPQTRHVVA